MNTKKILATGAVALSGLALLGGVAFAQVANNGNNVSINTQGQTMLTGTVSAVNGNTLSVTSWGGTWIVVTTDASKVNVGDKVAAQGAFSSYLSLNASKFADITTKTTSPPRHAENDHSKNGRHLGWLNFMGSLKTWFKNN